MTNYLPHEIEARDRLSIAAETHNARLARFGEAVNPQEADDIELAWDGNTWVLVLPGEDLPIRIAG